MTAPDSFHAFAENLACPDLASVIQESTPLGDPVKYTHPESAWHHYETLRSCPSGFLVCGDAFSSFNPVYGQGITVWALEALMLRELLNGPPAASSGPGGRYFRAAASVDPDLGTTFLRVANMIDKRARLLSPGHVMRVIRSARQAVQAGA